MNDLRKYKVAMVIGTRAELIKTFPVMKELEEFKIPYYFIHTGQHNLKGLCNKFSIKSPDLILSKEPEKSSRFNASKLNAIFWNVSMLFKIRKVLRNLPELKYVIFHGDTMNTGTGAIASSKLLNPFRRYQTIHLEAGLRSGDISEPFPEEILRKIADKFLDILLVVSNRSEENLKRYRNSKKIINIGNTVVDSASISYKMALKRKIKPLSKQRFALISVHRHENINNKERLSNIVEILSFLSIPSYFTLHDNTRKKLMEFGLYQKLISNKNIIIIAPMDYPEFVYQISKCSLIVCDGGSMQEESLIFKKPSIILRKATERQEGLKTNFQFLSKLDIEKTKFKINEYLSGTFKIKPFKNPYGEPGLSKKIVQLLKKGI